MSMRKITSLTLLLSFILTIVTSIILFIVPEGRVAYWAGWTTWGLSKSQWADLHINLGFLFLFAGLLHLWLNWRPILAYMKKAKQVKVFTPSFNAALALTLIVGIGTYFPVPPMSSILDLGQHFKDAGSEKYGEPPYGHAELSSLTMFAKRTYLDLDKAKELLQAQGIQVTSDKQTIAEIADSNAVTPKQLYDIIKAALPETEKVEGTSGAFPVDPPPGLGRRALADVCAQYGVDVNLVIAGLKERGIEASPDNAIREIAENQGTDPHSFWEILHAVAGN